MPTAKYQTGLTHYDETKATPGYTLFSPNGLTQTHLINMKGEVVHQWDLPGIPGNYAYLLANGNLLAATRTDEGPKGLPAKGGRLTELDWDGNTVWEHIDDMQNHDFRRKANGNTVYILWDLYDQETSARVKGGVPGTEHEDGGVYGTIIREVNPAGETVWEWRSADHAEVHEFALHPMVARKYLCANTVFPCPNEDVIVNWRRNNTMAIIDYATGKIKWHMRDYAYGQQHDVQLLENGNILFFANGANVEDAGPEGGSRIVEIDPETKEVVWMYRGLPPRTFFSWYISGCQRLASGNTLVCEGVAGRFFEVTPECEIVWEYASPYIVEDEGALYHGNNQVFRCYRYAGDSSEIGGRLPTDPT
ncbi:MAG: arylsulfotransferase family protein [Rhodospirillales bacterium]|jgi:hypothetical protein|nr:arylsulfotransferase family protein [Rhodospirillales bacterium]MDP6642659.1 arylsulfotransferase family protein [Rhodospirillales bacterium]MDP6840172.1 arylsulfotransferase family protein [Rhodospirillales bacterium]|tara:strand:- start:807 stop:1895 length:1089 start_codon:yes stop_codon:yes gene_type:complete